MSMTHLKTTMKKLLGTALAALALLAPGLGAQTSEALANIGGLEMDRDALHELRAYYQGVIDSPAYSGATKQRARNGMELIEERLANGDFRIGDRVVLAIQGEWANQADTFTVEAGPEITLPVMGKISLRGVLRSELETHMTRELGRFIQNPVVAATSLIRLQILGAVGQPGFYTVPSTMLLGEALMRAGGPATTARLDDLKISRGEEEIWEGDALQEAIADGLTLDQMSLRAGDQLELPGSSQRSNVWNGLVRWGVVLTASLLFGVRAFF